MIKDLMSRYEWALDSGNADAYGILLSEWSLVLQPAHDQESDARRVVYLLS